MDRRGGAQEGNGSARGWNARQHEAQSPPTPQNSDYQVRPVEVGARAPHNTPASPYGRAAGGGPLTPSHSDILDNFEPSQLQQQGMNTSARLEFPTRARGPCSVAAPVDSRSSISSPGSQSSSQKKKKALCADCPGRRPRLHSAPKRIPPRKYNGRRVSQRTPPCNKLLPVSNAGNTPRYEYIVRPADLLENQKEMITEANAKFIRTPATPPPIVSPFKSPHGGIEYDGLANDITAEEVRGLLMRVSARLLYAAIRRAQAEVGQMRGATPISEEERRRQHEEARRRQSEERRYQRLGSPIPLDLDLDDSVFESPQKEELQRNKIPSARVTFASSGAQTDPQKNRSIPWNLIEPKNLVRGLFHEWKQQHPGWETGKYRLKVDPSETSVASSRRQTSVTSVASSRRQRRQGQFGGPPNDPREATRALIRAFVKYQDEYINRHAGRNN